MHATRTLPPLALLAAFLTIGLCLGLPGAAAQDDKDKDKDKDKKKEADKDKKKDDKEPRGGKALLVTDARDKVHKVTDWKWLSGTRRLGWLAAEGKEAPEAFVFREETKVVYVAGVLTLIPLERLRKLAFDEDKKALTLSVTGAEGEEVKLEGAAKFKNINQFRLEADVDLGDKGVASFQFQGSLAKLGGNVKSITFPAPAAKVEPIKAGRPAVVDTADEDVKKSHKVSDLVALYAVGGEKERQKTSPTLMFKKTLKLDVNNLESIQRQGEGGEGVTWSVKPKDGEEQPLTLIQKGTLDGKQVELLGLVGKLPYGYRLFPVPRITAVRFDATDDKEKDKDKEKEKDKGKDE